MTELTVNEYFKTAFTIQHNSSGDTLCIICLGFGNNAVFT